MSQPFVLLTGAPGVGKSTLIQRVMERLTVPVGGFFTREVRQNGARVAFEIVTLEGETATIATTDAHVKSAHEARLAQYRVNLDAVDLVAIPAIQRARALGALVVVDEIGPMEIFSHAFCETVQDMLDDADCAMLGTIVARPYRFADAVKKHPRVELVTVTRANRNVLAETLTLGNRMGKKERPDV